MNHADFYTETDGKQQKEDYKVQLLITSFRYDGVECLGTAEICLCNNSL